jgi:glutamate dehydrogenase (NAD(P)+)
MKQRAQMHLQNILVRIEEAGRTLNLPDWMIETLGSFKMKSWSSDLEVKLDNGELKRYQACRVWHRSPHTDQPYKGGMRYHPLVNLDMMQGHAIEMSIKCWLMGIAWGGAKGGIAVNPSELSIGELKRITEALVNEMDERDILGPFRDVPAPDVGSTPQMMNWIRQRYAQRRRSREDGPFAGVVTGKPVGYGFDGIPGRMQATGCGVMHVVETVRRERLPTLGPRIAVMGYGNVGSHVVSRAKELGYTVVAVSDVSGGVYNQNGLDISALASHASRAKTITGFTGGDALTNSELLELPDIDILVPAALEHVITKDNAGRIKAKLIAEGANSPTTAEADDILESNSIVVIPDVCANAGGVTVSFFEWARNVSRTDERVPQRDNAQEVLNCMYSIMTNSVKEMLANADKHKTSLRNAAIVTSLDRVAPLFLEKHRS